jgi:uncharacterized protein involved in outer membrane biogenesis
MEKKILVVFALCVLALLVGIFSTPRFLNKDTVKDELMGSFKEATGLNLEIQGDAVMKTFPTPHIEINSVYVHNAQGAASPFLLSIRLVEIWPSLHSMFGGKLRISRIQVSGVDVELERLSDGKMNWQETVPDQGDETVSAPVDTDAESIFDYTRFNVTDGYLRFIDSAAGVNQEFKDVSINLINGIEHKSTNLDMSVNYYDRIFNIKGSIKNFWHAIYTGEVPASLFIKSGKSEIAYDGQIGLKNKKFLIKGNAHLKTDDAVPWIYLFSNGKERSVSAGTDYKPLPLIAKSEITTENEKITLPEIALEGAIIKGKMHAVITQPYQVNLTAAIDSLDLEALSNSGLFDNKNSTNNQQSKDVVIKDMSMTPSKSYLNLLGLSADIKCADIFYNHQHLRDTHIQFDMSQEEMSISLADSLFPGNSRVVFTGIGKEGFNGFTLEGEIDAAGDDFSEMAKVLKPKGLSIPSQDFKRFRLKTNAVISSKEIRLSELAARIENIAVVGGVIAHLDDRTTLEASLRIGGLNLDHFAELWGLHEWRTSFLDNMPGEKSDGFLARWLKRLGYDMKLNLLLEQYVLNGSVRDKSELEIVANMGKISFNKIKASYNGTELSGAVSIDVTAPLPKVDIKVTADSIDLDTFLGNKPTATAAKPIFPVMNASGYRDRWSHSQIDFHWLELFNGTYHFKFGRFKDGLVSADNVDIQGGVEDRTLNIDAITGFMFGAEIAGKAVITGGKIPSVNMAANVVSLDIEQLVPFIPVLRGIVGKYNLSLRLDTSGINIASWIANLEGTIGFGGRDVTVNGFNLPGVVRVVSYVRTVADILDVIKRAWPGGDTQFSSVEGQWTVSGGVMKTANSRLRNDLADVLLAGAVDLVNWRTDDQMIFSLKALDYAHPPTMTVQFLGDLDKPEMSLDTRSLEEYITNKTSQRMLEQYGTQ